MTFEEAVSFIIRVEGGYVFDPHDPGGETNMGISKRAYPHLEIKSLNRSAVSAIYKSDYWEKCWCDKLPSELQLMVLDAAVNQGQPTAISMLQLCAGVKPDGLMGEKTLAAIRTIEPSRLATRYSRARLKRYLGTTNFERNAESWLSRLIDSSVLSAKSSND